MRRVFQGHIQKYGQSSEKLGSNTDQGLRVKGQGPVDLGPENFKEWVLTYGYA